MTIGTNIFKRSFRKIQVDTLNSPASPEDFDDAVLVLNAMVATWLSKGIRLGIVPLEAAGDELGEPNDTTNAIISNLAIKLAADYEDGQAIVTQTLKNEATSEFEDLANSGYREIFIPQIIPSSTLVTGEGNKNRFVRRRNYFGVGRPLGK